MISSHIFGSTEIGRFLQSAIRIERWEELVEDDLCDVLGLGTHADSLGSNVHRENFRGPDPSCCAPRRLVKEDEEEEHEDD